MRVISALVLVPTAGTLALVLVSVALVPVHVAVALVVAAVVAAAARGLTVRVVEHPDGLVVHNLLRTRHLAWSEVTGLRVAFSGQLRCWYVELSTADRGARRQVRLHGATCWDPAAPAHRWDRPQGPARARWAFRTTVDDWCDRYALPADVPWTDR